MRIRRSSKYIALALVIMGLSGPVLADVKTGVDAWGRGDYKTAVNEWRGPAASGDADAQFNLAQAYKLGRGVDADLKEAEKWYKMAADQQHLQASDTYGLLLFQTGRREMAFPYLQDSAKRGEPRAQYVLGTGHFNGDYIEKDWIKAYALMTRSSAQGLPQATANLAQMDKYIPLSDRRRAIELAGQMEQDEKRVRTALVGGLRPALPGGSVKTAKLPPSKVDAPKPGALPVETPAEKAAAQMPEVKALPKSISGKSAGVAKTATPRPVTPAPVVAQAPSGKWRIQLGAFSDAGKAKMLWNRLGGSVSALSGLQHFLVPAGNLTRLQAGPFADRSSASAACAKVTASGNACFVRSK